MGVWSSPLFHPLPTFTEGALVNVGPGSVTSEPVGVYVGSSSGAPPLLIVEGGQATVDASEPAPEPPVCQALSSPSQGAGLPQEPYAVRGSVGIQPWSRPSEYDQAGEPTLPRVFDSPIFHVQKNQFYRSVSIHLNYDER